VVHRHDPDRRRFLRVEADLLAVCSPIDSAGERGDPVRMRTQNVSAGGAKLRGSELPRLGERFWIELAFARPRFLVFVEAEVVRTHADDTFAVRFVGLDEYVEQRVVRWVYAEDRRLFDRHAQARIPIRIKVICRRLADGEPGEEFSAPSVDLSADSVRIVSERVVLVGTTLQVELHLADDVPPFAVLGEVESAHPQDDERTIYTLRLRQLGVAEERRLVELALQIEREQRP
jgi:c-di-GMP-binding flagellar brake protein YcgR